MVTISDRNNLQKDGLLVNLARVMAGDFSNYQQSQADPQDYAHIRVFFRPLPWEFFSAIGFYSEQVYDYDLWTPYRQGIHRLIDRGDHIYVENYGLQDAMLYAGAGHNRDILKTIAPQCIERRHNCSMIFRQQANIFRGEVEPGNKCLIHRNGKDTYLVSDVEITENTWVSWDRGLALDTGEQIWGSAKGFLKFQKRASFADELPLSNLSI
jgi:CpeT protein